MIAKILSNKYYLISSLLIIALGVYYIVRFGFGIGVPDGDVNLYRSIASQWRNGGIPYIDFRYEYPPASIFVFIIPALFTLDPTGYVVIYNILSVIALLICSLLILKLSELFDLDSRTKTMVYFYSIILSIIILPIAINRFDTFSTLTVILGLYLYLKGIKESSITTRALGIVSVVLGVFIKLYPIFMLPFFGLYELKNRNWKALMIQTLIGGLFCLPFFVWMYFGKTGMEYFLSYHSDRGLQFESTYASVIVLLQRLGVEMNSWTVYEFATFGIRGPLPDILASISLYLFVIVLIITLVLFWLQLKSNNSFDLLLQASVVVNVGFASFNKVFSTQYVVWFLHLLLLYLVLISQKQTKKINQSFILCLYIGSSSMAIFPFFWDIFLQYSLPLSLLLVTRNALLILILVGIMVSMIRNQITKTWSQ